MGWDGGFISGCSTMESYESIKRRKEDEERLEENMKFSGYNADKIIEGFDSEAEYHKYLDKIKSGK